MKKFNLAILIVALLAGCTLITDYTANHEFSSFIDNDVQLKEQVLVCNETPLKSKSGESIDYELVFNINHVRKCFFGETVSVLPPGTALNIKRVEKHSIYSVKNIEYIYFIGSTVTPNGKPIEFYYNYGAVGYHENQPW
ncbi:MAG: hypothetical protein COC04_02145 [Gammaproteobacteria bacterium]|nr:MAG: hypothetical protein COC04_02145 [Gammaproteobacteria bacterium]